MEDKIIRFLADGSKTASKLLKLFERKGQSVSVQSIYKALRYLIKDSAVIKHSTKYSLSKEWADKVGAYLSRAGNTPPPLLSRESISYKFNLLKHLDSYWKQAVLSIQEINPDYPIFIYNSYGIWIHLKDRHESEVTFWNSFKKNRRHAFCVFGNESSLDKKQKKSFENEYLQFDLRSGAPYPSNIHFTIIKDYIVTTKLDRISTQMIKDIFNKTDNFEDVGDKLTQILNSPGKFALKIENDPDKAKRLRKELHKNFFISADLKSKYQLF